ncbi:MAG: glucosaminidase domain-containing protein [Porphyromonas sp.]|nr:glucosaminidase domain-containing protein [Porphyromonas sp.]
MKRSSIFTVMLFLLVSCSSPRQVAPPPTPHGARGINTNYNSYIERFAPLAYKHQRQYRIPASITLAQGLLESGAGQSTLARKANNHFGIKCHNSWRGAKTFHTDDRPNECFRAYSSPEESYADHADFLKKKRYAPLFQLDIRDYKGWAKGLQNAGYATDKAYANKLIKIIEDYRLYLVDQGNVSRYYEYNKPKKEYEGINTYTSGQKVNRPVVKENTRNAKGERQPYLNGNLLYVIAERGDNLALIAQEYNISEQKLSAYNDLPAGYPLVVGDIVYLQPKLSRAQPPHFEHIVAIGESIHTISQKYGIKLSSLYKINRLNDEYLPTEGDILKLR